MSFLYRSASGREVTHASYSAIADFDYCPQLFKLSRIDGYKEKEERGAFGFGKCVEDALQYFHANGMKPGDSVDEFKRLWIKFKDIPMTYSAQEGCFEDLYKMGSQMCQLYEVRLPTLPIRNPKFQLNYKKALWPGTELADLEFTSFIDMLVTAEDGSRIIVDIKTAKTGLDLESNMLSLDPQLKDYAWASGIRDVAFLWLVKAANPDSFKKGTNVTLLEDSTNWKAGQELLVFKYEENETGGRQVILGTDLVITQLEEALDQIKGKGSADAKNEVIGDYLHGGWLEGVPCDKVTKTKLQWVSAKIPPKELPETGQHIGGKMLQIKSAYENNFFPKTGGVRFPNQKCTFCRMRGLCLNKPDLVEHMLVRTTPKEEETDWLDDLEN